MLAATAASIIISGLILLNYVFFRAEFVKPTIEEKERRMGEEKTTEFNKTPPLRLEKADFISKPVGNNQFFMRLTGKNLNPEIVHLRVMGPGCGGDAPCIVSNGALRLYGQITEQFIEKAPLTLAVGEYQIWMENESGNISNKLTISVPAEVAP
jgi:hypothetical protein